MDAAHVLLLLAVTLVFNLLIHQIGAVTAPEQQQLHARGGEPDAQVVRNAKQPLHPGALALLKNGLLDSSMYNLHQPLERINVERIVHQPEPGIQIRLDSTSLKESGQWIEVSWQGVNAPSIRDWIALWVPASANFSQTAPSKWRLAAESLSHLSTGTGRHR